VKVLIHESPPFRMISPVVKLQHDPQLLDFQPGKVQRPNEGPRAEPAAGLLDDLVRTNLKDVILLEDGVPDLFCQPPVEMLISVEDILCPLVDVGSILSLLSVQVLQPVLQHSVGEVVHLARVEEPDPSFSNNMVNFSNSHLFNYVNLKVNKNLSYTMILEIIVLCNHMCFEGII